MTEPDRIPDGVEVWVQLTAMELYADLCNRTASGPDVLARALRLGYLRARREEEPLPTVLQGVAAED